jgi:DNA polymerase (family 10)
VAPHGLLRCRRYAHPISAALALGLEWIPPELREDHGEITAARDGRLPNLTTVKDLLGDLRLHTT